MLLAESYVHRLDPFAIRFSESFGIRWYGLAYAAGFVIVWLFLRWFARSGRSPLRPDSIGDLMTYVIIGVLVGGRLGYALFYDPALLVGFTSTLPWWDLLAIHKGGMSSHGGVLGVIVICFLFGRKHQIPGLHLTDMGAFSCTAGLFLGRLANFVNAELWGRRLPEARQADPPWWSVKYPEQLEQWISLDPFTGAVTGVDEARLRALADAAAAVDVAPAQWTRWIDAMDGISIESTLATILEQVREGNAAVIAALRDHLTAFYPSQLIQAATDGPILVGVLALIWLKPRVPGVVGAWFLVTYGVLRILTETVREPDEGVALWYGLSRGQSLSILMVVAGIVVLVVKAQSDEPKLGGLLKRREA